MWVDVDIPPPTHRVGGHINHEIEDRRQKESWIKLEKASSILTGTATQHFFYFFKISDVGDKKKQSAGYFEWKLQKYLNEQR